MMQTRSVIRKRYRKRRRMRIIRRICFMAVFLGVSAAAMRTAADHVSDSRPRQENIQTASVVVKRPIERQASQISRDLKIKADADPIAAQIYENKDRYPETMLAAYLNNPEMQEFVADYLDADPAEIGKFTEEEKNQEFPLLLQWDKRWGYVPYGGSIIGLSGCGPTCLSMVLVTLTGNEVYTPAQVAEFSEASGYYVEGSGTAWSLMTDGAAQYGLSVRELPLEESVMKSALDNGQPIICSVGAGDFTTQGHFILIRGYDADGFQVNDPNCAGRSEKAWPYEEIQGQIKNLWAYSKS